MNKGRVVENPAGKYHYTRLYSDVGEKVELDEEAPPQADGDEADGDEEDYGDYDDFEFEEVSVAASRKVVRKNASQVVRDSIEIGDFTFEGDWKNARGYFHHVYADIQRKKDVEAEKKAEIEYYYSKDKVYPMALPMNPTKEDFEKFNNLWWGAWFRDHPEIRQGEFDDNTFEYLTDKLGKRVDDLQAENEDVPLTEDEMMMRDPNDPLKPGVRGVVVIASANYSQPDLDHAKWVEKELMDHFANNSFVKVVRHEVWCPFKAYGKDYLHFAVSFEGMEEKLLFSRVTDEMMWVTPMRMQWMKDFIEWAISDKTWFDHFGDWFDDEQYWYYAKKKKGGL